MQIDLNVSMGCFYLKHNCHFETILSHLKSCFTLAYKKLSKTVKYLLRLSSNKKNMCYSLVDEIKMTP